MSEKLEITHFFRKPQSQYFSIEKVFEQVIKHLPESIVSRSYKLKTGTKGWWGRCKALLEAWQNKGSINHITGDITFIALALPKKGLIVTYHDLESLTQYQGWQLTILKYLWVTVPVRRAQLVTTISTHTKEQLIKWTNCDPEKIVVVPNPLPDEISCTPKTFNTQNPTILVMGTKDNKNVEGIFEAIHLLEAEIKSESLKQDKSDELNIESGAVNKALSIERFKLIVVGEMTPKQKALADKYQLDIDNLIQVPYEEIINAYKRCDFLCFPSFYEGFGLPIIEAQAMARPVITSNIGAMKEVAGHGAQLVDPYRINELAKAIKAVVLYDQLRNTLLTKGKENVQRFQAKNVAINYASVYQLVSGC